MRIYQDGDRVVLIGKGTPFLRLKTRVAKEVDTTHHGMGSFSIPQDAMPAIVGVLQDFGVDISEEIKGLVTSTEQHAQARNQVLEIIKKGSTEGLPSMWIGKLKDHQTVAVNAMTVRGLAGLCVFDEQGTGKTVMSIAAFDILINRKEVEKVLIICPKSVISSWENDFDKFAPEYTVAVVSGLHSQKTSILRDRDTDVFLLNYETLPNLEIFLTTFTGSNRCLLIADESFHVKNVDASRSVILRKLRRNCCRAFVLSGTPAPNAPIDLVNQFNIADNGYTFRGFVTTGNNVSDADIISHLVEERGTFIRRLKDQVLPELPIKKFKLIEVKMGGRQAALYDKAKEELILYLRTIDNQILKKSLMTYFAKRVALLQICSCPTEQDPLFSGTNAKLNELDNLLNRLILQEGKKVVVWSFYRASLNEISLRYKDYGLVRIDGGTNRDDRKDAIRQFQENDDIKLFVGNPAAAGAGITLHAAADSVFVSFSDQAAQFLQALDRTHRIGQQADEVCYHIIICKDTIEKNQVRILREKEMIQHGLLHAGGEFPSSLEDAFAELGEYHYE